jgi:NitT/TauT family transport system substrate-binding protein
MTIHRIRRGTFIAGAAALATLPATARAADTPAVSVGMVPLDIDGVVSYAQDLGYYQAAGVPVQLTMLSSGPAIINAVVGGSLDIGTGNVGSIIVARSKGLPVKLIVPAGIAADLSQTEPIAVRKDSTIQTGADLNGKTVAINAVKTMQHAAVLLWIDKHGGDSKTVKFVEMPISEMPAALDSRRVDAALPGEPFTTALKPNSRFIASQYGSMTLPFPIFAVFSTDQWLTAHPDTAAKFVSAVQKAATWSNAHHKDSAPMLARLTKTDPQLAETMVRTTYGTTVNAAMLQPIVNVLLRYGILEKPVDPNDLLWHAPSR